MAEGRVLYGHHGQVHVLRYLGDVRYPQTPALERFVQALFERERVTNLVVDLSEADSLDSTNFGELARIATRVLACGGRRPTIVTAGEGIPRLLHSMALDQVFQVIPDRETLLNDDPILPASLEEQDDQDDRDGHVEPDAIGAATERIAREEIAAGNGRRGGRTPQDLRKTMLEAHRALSNLSQRNREEFKDVLALLEQEEDEQRH